MNGLAGMNDRSEVGFIENFFYNNTNNEKSNEEIIKINNCFIISCNDIRDLKDNLTQWRLYAEQGRGCCLVFDVNFFQKDGFIIRPINYLDINNEKVISSELKALKEFINNNNFELRTLGKWSHFFKPKEYEIEKEIRVLYQPSREQYVEKKWLITNDYSIINPYCEFELFNESKYFPLKLREIILGFNCPESETNKMQLKALLLDRKINDVKISFSKVNSFR